MEDTDRILISDKGLRGINEYSVHKYTHFVLLSDGRKFDYNKEVCKASLKDPKNLQHAFTWRASGQGHDYWDRRRLELISMSQEDLNFLNWLVREDIEDHGE